MRNVRAVSVAVLIAAAIGGCGTSSSDHTTTVPAKVHDAQTIACWNRHLKPFIVSYTKRLLSSTGQTVRQHPELLKDNAKIVGLNAELYSAGKLSAKQTVPGIDPTLAATLKTCGKLPVKKNSG
jgi:type IV pilus biogenesis protein CpaD/CtpE